MLSVVLHTLHLNAALNAFPSIEFAPWLWFDGPTLQACVATYERALDRVDGYRVVQKRVTQLVRALKAVTEGRAGKAPSKPQRSLQSAREGGTAQGTQTDPSAGKTGAGQANGAQDRQKPGKRAKQRKKA